MTTWTKTCRCVGSFSGPRVVLEQRYEGETFRIVAHLLPFSCDLCGAALMEVPPKLQAMAADAVVPKAWA